ncbi:TonB-dependent siderophore receptor [Acaryochloris sp. IP29b_bin.148]|uniref:TonB-dependent siderophore receptor n=1 Tax=Acaryochloris sp. IP29b_bin.148 TaxID=2969218 RepID=UPI00263250D2|nr:TonB-dependent siderophore receptor [Acaryochloris sp. IP29b_bin.148]
MRAIKSLRLGLLVVGGWAIAPIICATPLKASAETSPSAIQSKETKQADPKQPPSTTVKNWMAQIEAVRVQITGVRLEETETGLQVVLETADGTLATPTTTVAGNVLTAEIPNAVLSLPEGEAFEAANPTVGIAQVSVTGLPGDQVQIAITGTDAPPIAEVTSSASGLVFAITPETVSAESVEDEEEELEITVTAERISSDTTILDTPASVQIIPREVFEEQGITKFSDALRLTPGVSQRTAPNSNVNSVNIRGFSVNSPSLRNGVPEALAFSLPRDLSNVERLEVLSGPASVIGGQISPGGIINIVTKQPLSSPFYELSASYGSFNTFEGAADLSGPLNSDKTLSYRLNASYLQSGTFIDADNVNVDRVSIAPVLSWDISDQTKLNIEGLYLNSKTPQRIGLPAIGTVLDNPNGEIPRDQFVGEPDFDQNDRQITQIGYDLNHQISDDWELHQTFRYTNLQSLQREAFVQTLQDDFRTLERRGNEADVNIDNFQVSAYIEGQFKTGPITHKLLAGIDYKDEEQFNETRRFEIGNIDLFEPTFTGVGTQFFQGEVVRNRREVGLYLQDKLSFWDDRLAIVLGGRIDFARFAIENITDGTPQESQNDTAFSPRVGILFKPTENVSLYGSFSRSFQQIIGDSATNEPFSPSRGTQYEVGVKADWLDKKLSTTLALYNLTQTNVLTFDPNDPFFDVQTGKLRSRGIELSTQGEILPNWNIIGSYTYTDAKVTADNRIPVGNRFRNVPEHSASLWTTYTIPSGSLQGLGFGLGLFYVGEREGNLDNSFQLPSYFRTDAAIYYKRDRFKVGLNVKNLFDIDYVESATDDLRVNLADPLAVQLSVSYEF